MTGRSSLFMWSPGCVLLAGRASPWGGLTRSPGACSDISLIFIKYSTRIPCNAPSLNAAVACRSCIGFLRPGPETVSVSGGPLPATAGSWRRLFSNSSGWRTWLASDRLKRVVMRLPTRSFCVVSKKEQKASLQSRTHRSGPTTSVPMELPEGCTKPGRESGISTLSGPASR